MVRTRILLVDEQPIMREGLRALLRQSQGLEVVGEAGGGEAAMHMIRDLSPDVVVMDVLQTDMDGAETTRRIKRESPTTKVLALGGNDNPEKGLSALKAGADGYLTKQAGGVDLVSAIGAIRRGESYVCQSLAAALIRECREASAPPTRELSDRQRHILKLIVAGQTSPQIAGNTGLRLVDVKTERRKLMRQLKVRNLIQLVKFGMRHGIGIENAAS